MTCLSGEMQAQCEPALSTLRNRLRYASVVQSERDARQSTVQVSKLRSAFVCRAKVQPFGKGLLGPAFVVGVARGMAARRVETLGSVHNSPVAGAAGDAPKPQPNISGRR